MTSPPRPPSPPSGPPIGTNFSRRNEEIPEPPSPAFTWMRARSMNVIADPLPESTSTSQRRRGDEISDGVQRFRHGGRLDADVPGAMQVREQLPVLRRRGARRHDAELAPRQVELRPAQHLAISFFHHPVVEEG